MRASYDKAHMAVVCFLALQGWALGWLPLQAVEPQAASAVENQGSKPEAAKPNAPTYEWDSLVAQARKALKRDNYNKATRLWRKSIRKAEKLRCDYCLGVSLIAFSSLSSELQDHAMAEKYARRSVSIAESMGSPEHPLLVESLDNLAKVYRTEGKHADADSYFRRALAIRKGLDQASAKHYEIVVLDNLAQKDIQDGNYRNAERKLKQVMQLCKRHGGDGDRALVLKDLARVYIEQGRLSESDQASREALSLIERSTAAKSLSLLPYLECITDVALAGAKFDEAARIYERELQMYENALGPSDDRTKAVRAQLEAFRKGRRLGRRSAENPKALP